MSDRLLQIDVSNSKNETKSDLIKIRLQNEDNLQFNFYKFYIQSAYLLDNYKYSEALDLIQYEIEKMEKEFHVSSESIKYFIQLIQAEKVQIPINHYIDIYTLSEYFNVQKIIDYLDKIGQKNYLNSDLTVSITE